MFLQVGLAEFRAHFRNQLSNSQAQIENRVAYKTKNVYVLQGLNKIVKNREMSFLGIAQRITNFYNVAFIIDDTVSVEEGLLGMPRTDFKSFFTHFVKS